MPATVYLLTPPFTQLNTPYPATAYLKGFLNTRQVSSFQADLGIEVTNALFSKTGLQKIFSLGKHHDNLSDNALRILALHDDYLHTIEPVILFLQGKNPTLAPLIVKRNFLPEASRFQQVDDLQWAFGSMGNQDKAKHLATMYLEDIADFIRESVDPHFGFSRYAEKLGRSANTFDALHEALQQPFTYVDEVMINLLENHLQQAQPRLVAISVPFPGNLYAAFRCGQWVKKNHPAIRVAMGGGFPNTELRSITDNRVFSYFDFISLDDGEAPLERLVHYIDNSIAVEELKRTFVSQKGKVTYVNNAACTDYRQGQVGTPDYSDLPLDKYINAIEVVNPMHSLWSDGRWNKLTMAHGCYWGKCTFCDISLDYIKNYEPLTATVLCDRMEEIIAQTGQNGFHFVDEAAPPALMRSLALEIIKRKLVVSWWTNIRFEKSFTRDLCLLLKTSGCIAVSGGLEVASDRLLQLIQKGITVAQVARVNKHFTEAGIMVHAYLMYGFPTQTEQETIDALEMVRQMFETGVMQSAFWHLFTMTAHSPVGMNPDAYQVRKKSNIQGSFANNDIDHIDLSGADHEQFAFGLKKSLHNFMHGIGIGQPLQKWFDFKIPKTTIAPGFIAAALAADQDMVQKTNSKVVFLGHQPELHIITKSKKGQQWQMAELTFQNRKDTVAIRVSEEQGSWLSSLFQNILKEQELVPLQRIKQDYSDAGLEDFELFWDNKPVSTLYKAGLLHL